jgi:S-DNA-T family DNA segregation ATPase FtsK/SpoIIIE
MLQRRFRIGYNRAARLVDMMEERGMVGPADGARPRKVLMTKEEFDEYVQRTAEIEAEIF